MHVDPNSKEPIKLETYRSTFSKIQEYCGHTLSTGKSVLALFSRLIQKIQATFARNLEKLNFLKTKKPIGEKTKIIVVTSKSTQTKVSTHTKVSLSRAQLNWKKLAKACEKIGFGKGVRKGEFRLGLKDYAGEALTSRHLPKECNQIVESYQKQWLNFAKDPIGEDNPRCKYGTFWEWFDAASANDPMLPKTGVVYANSETRTDYLGAMREGLLLSENENMKDNIEYAVVVGTDNKLYLTKKIPGEFQHSSFFAGKPVRAACCIKAKNGIIQHIKLSSGHYLYEYMGDERAQKYSALKILQILIKMGVNIENAELSSSPSNPKPFKYTGNLVDYFKQHQFDDSGLFSDMTNEQAEICLHDKPLGSWLLRSEGGKHYVSKILENSIFQHFPVEEEALLEDLSRRHGLQFKDKEGTQCQILPS